MPRSTRATGGSARIVLRARLSLGLYLAVTAIVLAALVPLLLRGEWRAVAAVAPIPVLAAGFGWVLLAAPRLEFGADAVLVRNPLRSHLVPYARIRQAHTRRGFALDTDSGRVQAWAAPPPGRLQAERVLPDAALRRDPRIRRDADGSVAVSDAPGTPSGDAALTLAERLRSGARAGAEAPPPVEHRWLLADIMILVLSTAVALLAAMLGD